MTPAGSVTTLTCPKISSERYLLPTANIYPSKATLSRRPPSDPQSQSDTNVSVGAGTNVPRAQSAVNGLSVPGVSRGASKTDDPQVKNERRVSAPPTDDLDVQSIINERRPSKLKSAGSMAASSNVNDRFSSTTRAGSYGRVYVAEERSEDASPMSTGNASSDSTMGSCSASGSVNGSASGSGSRGGSAVAHTPEEVCAAIGSDVRIYVDDTDSTSSNSRRGKTSNDETPDGSTIVSSGTTVRRGTDGTEETEERSERVDRPSDPS